MVRKVFKFKSWKNYFYLNKAFNFFKIAFLGLFCDLMTKAQNWGFNYDFQYHPYVWIVTLSYHWKGNFIRIPKRYIILSLYKYWWRTAIFSRIFSHFPYFAFRSFSTIPISTKSKNMQIWYGWKEHVKSFPTIYWFLILDKNWLQNHVFIVFAMKLKVLHKVQYRCLRGSFSFASHFVNILNFLCKIVSIVSLHLEESNCAGGLGGFA